MPSASGVTIGSSVFLAILAMDSYNRGHRPGIDFTRWLNVTNDEEAIGAAAIGIDSLELFGTPSALATGFSATAYTWNGTPVISYRGTDYDSNVDEPNFLSTLTGRDIWQGWTVGLGFPGGQQAQLALEFYRQVAGVDSVYFLIEDQPSITLLGHSLGGGLAGFVGALSGQLNLGYDHMPFGIAAYAQAISDSAVAAADVLGLDWETVLAVLAGPSNPIAYISGIITFQRFVDEFAVQFALREPAIGMTSRHIDGEILELVRSGAISNIVGAMNTGTPWLHLGHLLYVEQFA